MGYKSLADFVTDAVREKCEKLDIFLPEMLGPPLEHFNISEHGVRVLDRTVGNGTSKGRIIDVYFKPEKVLCEYCDSNSCRHVQFARCRPADQAGILRIEFYLQDVLVCTLYEAPYQWSWDTTQYPNGEYTITTKAYDTVGHAKTSQTQVTVNNIESPWWQTHFWTIMQVLVGVGGLIVAILAYLTRTREKKKKKK